MKQQLRFWTVLAGLLALCTAMAIALHARPKPIFSPGHAVIRILEIHDGKAVAEAMTVPRFELRVEEGQVNEHDVLELEQDREVRHAGNMKYPVVVLRNGTVKLALVAVDLTVTK